MASGCWDPVFAAIAENTLGDDYEVIVLDNGSEEPGIEDARSKLYPKVRLNQGACQSWLFARNNLAARQARGEYLVFLNNDTLPRRDWLRPLVEMQRALLRQGLSAATWWMLRTRRSNTGSYFQPAINAYEDVRRNYPPMLSTTARVRGLYRLRHPVSSERVDQVGGFDDTISKVYEDFDLCLKVRSAPEKVMYIVAGTYKAAIENVSMKSSPACAAGLQGTNREFFRETLASR